MILAHSMAKSLSVYSMATSTQKIISQKSERAREEKQNPMIKKRTKKRVKKLSFVLNHQTFESIFFSHSKFGIFSFFYLPISLSFSMFFSGRFNWICWTNLLINWFIRTQDIGTSRFKYRESHFVNQRGQQKTFYTWNTK